MPKELQEIDNVSNVIHILLESSNSVVEKQIDNLMERYNEINEMKDIYHEAINRESTVRKISREEM